MARYLGVVCSYGTFIGRELGETLLSGLPANVV